MEWQLSNGDMMALAEYADRMWETCRDMRILRNQGNETINRKQDMQGKACEFIAWEQATSEGRKLLYPDLTIYKPEDKTYMPDLVSLDGLPNIHVKQISTYDGLSIVFSRARNEIIRDQQGWLWGVMLSTDRGNYHGYVAVRISNSQAMNYISEMTKLELQKSKYCIRLEDLPLDCKLFT